MKVMSSHIIFIVAKPLWEKEKYSLLWRSPSPPWMVNKMVYHERLRDGASMLLLSAILSQWEWNECPSVIIIGAQLLLRNYLINWPCPLLSPINFFLYFLAAITYIYIAFCTKHKTSKMLCNSGKKKII